MFFIKPVLFKQEFIFSEKFDDMFNVAMHFVEYKYYFSMISTLVDYILNYLNNFKMWWCPVI